MCERQGSHSKRAVQTPWKTTTGGAKTLHGMHQYRKGEAIVRDQYYPHVPTPYCPRFTFAPRIPEVLQSHRTCVDS
jgi:hypothetical protein